MLFWDAAVHETLCWGIPCRRPAAATNIRGATVSMRPAPPPPPPLDFGARLSGGQPIAKLRAHAHCRMAFVRCHGAHFAGTTEWGEMAERPVDHFRRAQRTPRISKTASLESIGSADNPRGRGGAMGVARVWGVRCFRRKIYVVGSKLGRISYTDCMQARFLPFFHDGRAPFLYMPLHMYMGANLSPGFSGAGGEI